MNNSSAFKLHYDLVKANKGVFKTEDKNVFVTSTHKIEFKETSGYSRRVKAMRDDAFDVIITPLDDAPEKHCYALRKIIFVFDLEEIEAGLYIGWSSYGDRYESLCGFEYEEARGSENLIQTFGMIAKNFIEGDFKQYIKK